MADEDMPSLPGIVHALFTKSLFRSGRDRSSAEDFAAAQIAFSELNLEAKPFAAGSAGQVFRGTFNKGIHQVAAKATFDSMWNKSNEELEQEVCCFVFDVHA